MSGIVKRSGLVLKRRRRLLAEKLENRWLLAAQACFPAGLSTFSDSLFDWAQVGGVSAAEADGIAARDQESLKGLGKIKDKSDVQATHHYVSDGVTHGMVIDSDQVVLEFESAVRPSIDRLYEGAEYVRSIDGTARVYRGSGIGDAAMRQYLSGIEGVATVAPVFVMASSGSEAVLLDEIIIALKPGVQPEVYFAKHESFSSYRPLIGTPDQFIATIGSGAGEIALEVANQSAEHPEVAWTSPNFYQSWRKLSQPNDPRFANQWHLENTGQGGGVAGEDVSIVDAWDTVPGGSTSLVIGIVDDGIELDHPDLNLWVNPGETPFNGIDDDGNGWVDDVNGWNFVADNNEAGQTTATDMHGTAVAGVAAARGDNGIGVAGASYGTPVMSVRIFEGDSVASDANIASAIYYVSGRTADGNGIWDASDLANHSWGGGGTSTAINNALTWGTTNGRSGLGATHLFATGNEFGAVSEPARQSANIPGVVAVGAHTNIGLRSGYSNFGPELDIMAPSDGGLLAIDTTDRLGTAGYAAEDYTGTGSSGFGGTSSATPLATGVTALALARAASLSIDLTPPQVRQLLRANTDLIGPDVFDMNTGKNSEYGYGRINASTLVAGIGSKEISVLSGQGELISGSSTYDFGEVEDETTVDVVFRVRNQGTETLELTSLTVDEGPFTIVQGLGASSLALGESTTFTVRFTAVGDETTTRQLRILSNDADEGEFIFTLSGTSIFPSIVGVVFEDGNANGEVDWVYEFGVPNVGVYLDVDGDNNYDSTTTDFTQSDPVDIFDNTVVFSDVTVSGIDPGANWTGLTVKVNIDHTYTSDLDLFLTSPSGQTITLASRVGLSGDNFVNTVFDDLAAQSINEGTAPFTGTFRPEMPLAALVEGSPNGQWRLSVADNATQDVGRILNWTVSVITGEPIQYTDSSGWYIFYSLLPGEYKVNRIVPESWSATLPGAAGHTGDLGPLGSLDETLIFHFGMAVNNRFYATVFDDADEDGIYDDDESPRSELNVFVDANGNGVFDSGSLQSFSNTNPVNIPDNQTVTSTINVSDVNGNVSDVDVRVDITHTYDSDLDVFLVGPGGQRVELFTDVGGSGDNFTDTILDDEATTSITAGSAPFTGLFIPEGSLSIFDGLDPNGAWMLEISDDAGGDTGQLLEWELVFLVGREEYSEADHNGKATLDLSTGTWPIGVDLGSDEFVVLPVGGFYSETPDGTPLTGRLFGTSVAQPPTDVTLSNDALNENTPTTDRVLVGTFSASDANESDTHTFALVAGDGDADNGSFVIEGNQLFVKAGEVLDSETKALFAFRVETTDSFGLTIQKGMTFSVLDLPEVEEILVADSAQRSRIETVQVRFDQEVSIAEGAFAVVKRGASGGAVGIDVTSQVVNSQTIATLTFSGQFFSAGSLVDGNYQLTIDASKVTAGGEAIDGDRDGTAGGNALFGEEEADAFYRFYGDKNGDRAIGFPDFIAFRTSFGTNAGDTGFDSIFDANDDGAVGFPDFIQFRARFGTNLPFE